jgi:SAM-dependent methyltransferase
MLNGRQQLCHRLVRDALPPGSSVLEASCGKGDILRALREDGYAVCGTNFSTYDELPTGIAIHSGVDLRASLPFADNAFDGIILCDVIEHVSDHMALIAELRRVLKPGGFLVILSPNTNRLISRLRFLWTGFFQIKRAFIGFDVPPEKAFAFHNHPPHLPVFLYETHSQGMTFVRFETYGVKIKSIVAWCLLAPWIWLSTALVTRYGERNLRGTPAGRLIFGIVASFRGLCGEFWATVHRKNGESAGTQEIRTSLPAWHRTAPRDGSSP